MVIPLLANQDLTPMLPTSASSKENKGGIVTWLNKGINASSFCICCEQKTLINS